MLLILTHENADFDAVASQMAAQKLYPEGTPLLSRRLNRNVSQFLTLYWDVLPFVRAEDWRRARVDKVVLVDTQSLSSVRGVRAGVEVQVIDHHEPQTPEAEMPASWSRHVAATGATATLLAEMLQASGLSLTPIEATLLLLGVYEDTGSLTYDTTTTRDAQAAAWLLAQGARLPLVRRFMEIPLTEAQQALYLALQQGSEWLSLEGHSVLLAVAEAPPDFDDEVSSIAHRMRDALVPDALLMLVKLAQHIQLVARSGTERIDVGELARAFGGGGHSRAAAATILSQDLPAIRQQMVDAVQRSIKPMVKVAEMMSHGVQILPAETLVHQAAAQMLRFGHEGYPVVEEGRLVGLLTRRAVDRAMNHQLGHLPVRQIMRAGHVTVTPEDSSERVQQLMIEEGWGQVPVVASDDPRQIIGIVTRTDLLNLLSQPAQTNRRRDARALMAQVLQPAVWQLVQAAGQVAADHDLPLYFVGGLVRDLLLHKPPVDIDMVVEGDAIALAQLLRRRFGGRVRSHARFGTAKWVMSPEVWGRVAPGLPTGQVPATIDFVTARTEFYARPTALPEVERGSIKLDLHRRDFTINTLAIRLDGAHLGQMLDFYGGQRDLDNGIIRVLHSLSFVDDPTRILRAVRFEQRLGFTIERRTEELITGGLAMLDRVTGERIRNEIELALTEADPVAVLQRLDEIGVLRQLQPALRWQPEVAESFARVPALLADPLWQGGVTANDLPVIYFILWLLPLPIPVQSAVMDRLRVRKATRADLEATRQLLGEVTALPHGCAPSLATRLIRPYGERARVLLAALAHLGEMPAASLILHYQRAWRHVRPILDGHALLALGVARSPLLGAILDQLLAARLDGTVVDEAGEKALALSLMAAANRPQS